VRNGIGVWTGTYVGAGTGRASGRGARSCIHVVHQRLHEFLNLSEFAERVELGELYDELVGIERVERALVLELHG